MNILFWSVILFLAFYLNPPLTSAHFTLQDNNTTVMLHMNPGDHPIANDKATLIFMFLRTEKNFSLQKCECSLSIYQQGRKILTQPLSSYEVDYVFHEKDVYTLELQGRPLKPNDFQSFNLKWDVRVDKDRQEINKNAPDPTTFFTFLIIALVSIFLIIVFIQSRKKKGGV